MIFNRVVPLMMAAMMLFTTACSKNDTENPEDSTVKVTVNGKAITEGEYKKTLAECMQVYESHYGDDLWNEKTETGKTYKETFEESVLDNMILEIVLVEEAEKCGIAISDEKVTKELEKYKGYFSDEEEYLDYLDKTKISEEFLRGNIKKELIMKEFLNKKSADIDKIVPSEEELRKMYDENPILFNEIRASHILVDSKKESRDILEKINNGEDFSELAKKYSKCSSAENGGDLGYFTYADMVKEFSETAFDMAVDEISDPVKTAFGYHIIKVTDKHDKFEEIDKENLDYQFKSAKYIEMIDEYKSSANIVK